MLTPPLLPDNAPFTAAQRAYLNGFFAGLLNLGQMSGCDAAAIAGMAKEKAAVPMAAPPEFEAPWHDPALDLPERMKLALGRPLPQRLMAAMGQLDCGQCGYECKVYALKLADGSEPKQNLCVPGGRATQRMLRELLAETPAAAPAPADAVAAAPGIGRANPVEASLKTAIPLNAPGSGKDTRHVVIDLSGTGLAYRPGDSLGVRAANDPELVDRIIAALGADPTTEVGDGNGHARSLRQALAAERDLRNPSEAVLTVLAECASAPAEAAALRRLSDGEDPDLDLLDLLERFPSARPSAKPLVAALDELQPRLYSIASSPRAHAGEVHLTVGVVGDEIGGRLRRGVASNHLARVNGKPVPLQVYVQPSHGFALPADDATPIVMIGPGTGIAPFRAFLHERRARGAKGRNWLFFGNPKGAEDFLYREELEALQREGVLSRLDTAFSRDQSEKVYVQHRLLAARAELWRWLERGAHLYVCGDAKRMAADVDRTLREVVAAQGGMGEAAAKSWLGDLARAGRYQRDVY